jgi:hypothetical protein
MSRTITSFFITVGLVAPVAWHATDATIESEGKRLRPLQQSFTIDGTRFTLDVDRELVMTGDTVTAKVRAYGPRKQVAVDLRLLHTSNYSGERVEQPWRQDDRETLQLTAAPNGGPVVDTQLVLGKKPSRLAQVDSFKVYLAPHGQKPPTQSGIYSEREPDYRADVEAGKAAAVEVEGWSGNSMLLSINPVGKVTSNAPFTVAVRVKNTSGDVLPHGSYVELSTDARYRDLKEGEEAPFTVERIDENDDAGYAGEHPMKRGAVKVVKFRVTPNHPTSKQLTLIASTAAMEDAPGPVIAGAKEVRTFDLVEAKDNNKQPTVASK